jgi:hypothetical protein
MSEKKVGVVVTFEVNQRDVDTITDELINIFKGEFARMAYNFSIEHVPPDLKGILVLLDN